MPVARRYDTPYRIEGYDGFVIIEPEYVELYPYFATVEPRSFERWEAQGGEALPGEQGEEANAA
jgi:hypothetical protein